MDFQLVIEVRSHCPEITHQAVWRGIWGELLLSGTKTALVSAQFVSGVVSEAQSSSLPAPWGSITQPLTVILVGTTFQCRVWCELATLCQGERISYQDLAQRIQHPRAVRAVASAVASNPLPIILPCHRIVRTDGRIGQYQAGTDCKQRLLNFETSGACL